MEADYIIDEMTEEDLAQVLEIERSSFHSPWSKDLFIKELQNKFSVNLVARVAKGYKKVVGYVVFWNLIDEIHLLDLAVHKDFRNQGIGRRLTKKVIETGRKKECRHVYLEVRKSNAAAMKLYSSLDFREVGIRKRYYDNGEDAVIMTLDM